MKIIAMINQKGGVGKTTTTVNLAAALALQGCKVTILDMDPQNHVAASLGHTDLAKLSGMDEVFLHQGKPETKAIQTRENFQFVPAGAHLSQAEAPGALAHAEILKEALQGQFEDQDYVFMDCPPSSGLLVVNALFATDDLLIPVTSDYLGLQGLSFLMGTLVKFDQRAQKQFNKRLIMTKYHKRRKICTTVKDKLLEYFPSQVLETPIRETSALAACSGFGQTVFEFDKASNGAKDCKKLAKDFIKDHTL